MGGRSKIILFNEYGKSEWASLIPKHDNFLLNKNTNFPYSSSFESSPSNHLLKIIIYTSFFITDSTFLQKMDHFDVSFVIWKVSRIRELTKPTYWIRTTSQVAFHFHITYTNTTYLFNPKMNH